MFTAWQFAVLAGNVLKQVEAASTAQTLRPETIVNVNQFGSPTIVETAGAPQVLRPSHLLNSSALHGATLSHVAAQILAPETIVNVNQFGSPTIAAAVEGHRYWRVLFEGNASGNAMEIRECEFANTRGGSNLATGGTPAASTGTAANAFDGNTASGGWIASSAAVPQWLSYDFGVGQAPVINEVRLYPTSNPARVPTTFKLQYSDDNSAWTDWMICPTNGTWSGVQNWFKGAVAYRILVTNNNGNATLRISEMEFRATAGGADESGAGLGDASSNRQPTHVAEQAFADDGATTTWSATFASGDYLRYDFVAGFTLAQYAIMVSVNTNSAPRDWTIERSDDGGLTWSTVDTRSAVTGWTNNVLRVFTI